MKTNVTRLALLLGMAAFASAAEPGELRKLFQRPRIFQPGAADAKLGYQMDRQRASLVTSADVVLPFILNGEGLITRIRLVNMEGHEVPFEMFFVDDEGFEQPMPVKGRGRVASLRGRLAVGGGLTIETNGQGSNTIAWAFFDAGRNRVGATATVEIETESGVFAASYTAQFLGDTLVRVSFDNTLGAETEISVINTNTRQAEVAVRIRGEDGAGLAATRLSMPGLGAMGISPAELARGARNARGTVELSIPADSRGGIAVLSIQFFDPGGFTFLPGFATVN